MEEKPPPRWIGSRQKEIVAILLAGGHISDLRELCPFKQSINLNSDEDSFHAMLLPNQVESMVKKGIIAGKMVYSTVQPDTEHYRFELTKDAKKWFGPTPQQAAWIEWRKTEDYIRAEKFLKAKGMSQPFLDNLLRTPFDAGFMYAK